MQGSRLPSRVTLLKDAHTIQCDGAASAFSQQFRGMLHTRCTCSFLRNCSASSSSPWHRLPLAGFLSLAALIGRHLAGRQPLARCGSCEEETTACGGPALTSLHCACQDPNNLSVPHVLGPLKDVDVVFVASGPAACHCAAVDSQGRLWTWGRGEVCARATSSNFANML